MKALFIILISICSFHTINAQGSFDGLEQNLIISFNPRCMSVYEYHTDQEYIVEDSYTNYHIPISPEETFILKVLTSAPSFKVLPNRYKQNIQIISCDDRHKFDKSLVKTINYGFSNIFLKVKEGKQIQYYKVQATIHRTMNKEYMEYYSPPYASFIYHYHLDHNPGSPIPANDIVNINNLDVRFLLYGESSLHGVRKDIFLKMYNDACHNRDYGITVPLSEKGKTTPYLGMKNSQGKILYRSCQHPIQSEYLSGIGLYKEFYYEGSKGYFSQLKYIDGIQIDTFMTLIAANYQYEGMKNPRLDDHNIGYVTRGKKEGKEEEDTETETETETEFQVDSNGNKIPKRYLTPDFDGEKEMFGGSRKQTSKESKSLIKQVHTVQKGDTLYNISKRYNITVAALKKANNLKDNIIEIGEQLTIPK